MKLFYFLDGFHLCSSYETMKHDGFTSSDCSSKIENPSDIFVTAQGYDGTQCKSNTIESDNMQVIQ